MYNILISGRGHRHGHLRSEWSSEQRAGGRDKTGREYTGLVIVVRYRELLILGKARNLKLCRIEIEVWNDLFFIDVANFGTVRRRLYTCFLF